MNAGMLDYADRQAAEALRFLDVEKVKPRPCLACERQLAKAAIVDGGKPEICLSCCLRRSS